LKKHNLSTNSTPEQLSEHVDELNAFLPNWQARRCVKVALTKRSFSKEQIGVFVPDVRKNKLTIRERAQHCVETGDKWDIYIHAMDLLSKNDDEKEIVASSSNFSKFCKHLAEAGVDSEQIDYGKFPDITHASNKIQKKQVKLQLLNPSKIPKHFSLEKGLKTKRNKEKEKKDRGSKKMRR
jgi:hypothetical protein